MSSNETTSKSSSSGNNKSGRKSASLPPETVEYLKAWMMSPEHVAHPYPTEQEKAQIMAETGIELKQLTNWFVNNRKRFWKPRVEAKLQQKYAVAAAAQVQGVPMPGLTPTAAAAAGTTTALAGSPTSQLHHQHHRLSISSTVSAQARPQDVPSSAAPQSPGSYQMLTQPTFQQPAMAAAPSSPSLAQAHVPPVAALQQQHQQPQVLFPPPVAYSVEDPHTVSEASASSSTCISDDDSTSSFAHHHHNMHGIGAAISGMNALRRQSSLLSTAAGTIRVEEVDVHVLKPETTACESNDEGANAELPTIRDLTIKANVPKERILATFPKCQIKYVVPVEIESDRKKVQSRRDGEVLRVKKHYLKLYLATLGVCSPASPVGDSSNITAPWDPEESTDSPVATTTASQVQSQSTSVCTMSTLAETSSRVRACTDLDQTNQPDEKPRKRPRTSSGNIMKGEDEWREACLNAKSVFCESLPGLEEAARMFGYISN